MHTPNLGVHMTPDALAHKLNRSYEEATAIIRALASHDRLLKALDKILAYHPYAQCDGRIEASDCDAIPCSLALAAIREAKGE